MNGGKGTLFQEHQRTSVDLRTGFKPSSSKM